jgi:hypothetical protein
VVGDIITFELDRPCNASCICKIISDGDSFFAEAQEVNIPDPADAGTHMLTDFSVVSASDDTQTKVVQRVIDEVAAFLMRVRLSKKWATLDSNQ